ncbi:hypothetical protein [uncultured Oscillibacter sp.]|uniref:hypothetical protein n=1 Tax=uncultured Oscillibacter sp. TaxID=876091 RepID=UPI002625273B|nr:hypothetical protein [uncultured Oscillibacter sp.]
MKIGDLPRCSADGAGSVAAVASAFTMSVRWYFPSKYLQKNPAEARDACWPVLAAATAPEKRSKFSLICEAISRKWETVSVKIRSSAGDSAEKYTGSPASVQLFAEAAFFFPPISGTTLS